LGRATVSPDGSHFPRRDLLDAPGAAVIGDESSHPIAPRQPELLVQPAKAVNGRFAEVLIPDEQPLWVFLAVAPGHGVDGIPHENGLIDDVPLATGEVSDLIGEV